VVLVVPHDRGEVISKLHLTGRVLTTDYLEEGTRVTAMVHPRHLADVEPFIES
jgi:GTPase